MRAQSRGVVVLPGGLKGLFKRFLTKSAFRVLDRDVRGDEARHRSIDAAQYVELFKDFFGADAQACAEYKAGLEALLHKLKPNPDADTAKGFFAQLITLSQQALLHHHQRIPPQKIVRDLIESPKFSVSSLIDPNAILVFLARHRVKITSEFEILHDVDRQAGSALNDKWYTILYTLEVADAAGMKRGVAEEMLRRVRQAVRDVREEYRARIADVEYKTKRINASAAYIAQHYEIAPVHAAQLARRLYELRPSGRCLTRSHRQQVKQVVEAALKSAGNARLVFNFEEDFLFGLSVPRPDQKLIRFGPKVSSMPRPLFAEEYRALPPPPVLSKQSLMEIDAYRRRLRKDGAASKRATVAQSDVQPRRSRHAVAESKDARWRGVGGGSGMTVAAAQTRMTPAAVVSAGPPPAVVAKQMPLYRPPAVGLAGSDSDEEYAVITAEDLRRSHAAAQSTSSLAMFHLSSSKGSSIKSLEFPSSLSGSNNPFVQLTIQVPRRDSYFYHMLDRLMGLILAGLGRHHEAAANSFNRERFVRAYKNALTNYEEVAGRSRVEAYLSSYLSLLDGEMSAPKYAEFRPALEKIHVFAERISRNASNLSEPFLPKLQRWVGELIARASDLHMDAAKLSRCLYVVFKLTSSASMDTKSTMSR